MMRRSSVYFLFTVATLWIVGKSAYADDSVVNNCISAALRYKNANSFIEWTKKEISIACQYGLPQRNGKYINVENFEPLMDCMVKSSGVDEEAFDSRVLARCVKDLTWFEKTDCYKKASSAKNNKSPGTETWTFDDIARSCTWSFVDSNTLDATISCAAAMYDDFVMGMYICETGNVVFLLACIDAARAYKNKNPLLSWKDSSFGVGCQDSSVQLIAIKDLESVIQCAAAQNSKVFSLALCSKRSYDLSSKSSATTPAP